MSALRAVHVAPLLWCVQGVLRLADYQHACEALADEGAAAVSLAAIVSPASEWTPELLAASDLPPWLRAAAADLSAALEESRRPASLLGQPPPSCLATLPLFEHTADEGHDAAALPASVWDVVDSLLRFGLRWRAHLGQVAAALLPLPSTLGLSVLVCRRMRVSCVSWTHCRSAARAL